MLNNYERLPNGVIRQINKEPFKYDNSYIQTYNNLGELGKRMAYLRFGYIQALIKEGIFSIMDVGYGNGDFLSVCKEMIPNCYGYDISGYPIPEGCQFETDLKRPVDVITFFDSLEHFEDISFVKDINAKYVVVSLPWFHEEFTDEEFEKWKHRKPNEHLWHFSHQSLNNFMDECGFDLVFLSNIEDAIRKSDNQPNILTGVYINRKYGKEEM